MYSNPTRQQLANVLPRCLAGPLTWLTGVMAEGQTLGQRSKKGRVIQSFATFGVGVAGGVAALPLAGDVGLLALPPLMAAAIAGARDLQLTILHHCAHDNVLSGAGNTYLGRVISSLLQIERFDSYKLKHTKQHHGRNTLSTLDDDTAAFLIDVLGLKAGASVPENRRRILAGLYSPRVHATMLKRRLKSQFIDGGWANRLVAGSYLAAVASFCLATGWWIPVALGWILPLTIGYNDAQILRLVVEHRWPEAPAANGRRSRDEHDRLTVAVRCAVPPPAQWTPSAAAAWAGEMAFNVTIRCMVLPGDSGPSHHWHHGTARGDWANHIPAAAKWEDQRLKAGLPPSREAWGYREAFRQALESFAAASPQALTPPDRPATA